MIDIKTLIRCQSPIYNSVSKQMYSFGKAERFKRTSRKDALYSFYSLPDTKSKRGSSIGYGKKSDITQGKKELSIFNCFVQSSFSPKAYSSNQCSFGIGRISDSIGKIKDISPGPRYNTSKNLGSDAPSCVIGESNKSEKANRYILSPGPGEYNQVEMNSFGNYFVSKFQNVKSTKLDSRAKRFIYKINNTPGPGEYKLPSLINKQGFIFQSNFKAQSPRSILGKHLMLNKRDITPGPGHYNIFSDFE